jgi:hypothetical protein
VWGAEATTVADNTFYGVGSRQGTIYYGSGGWSASRELAISGNTLAFCYDGIGKAGTRATRIAVTGNTLYATMGGIRGDVSAVGNVITFDPGNAATRYSIQALAASGNRLVRSRGIATPPDGVANIRGNTVEDCHGPAIVSADNHGALIAGNVLRSRLPGATAILLAETASGNRIADNWISADGVAMDLRGSRSAVTGNLIRTAAEKPVRDAGEGNTVRDNTVLPPPADPADENPGW